jgi:hypothetical protein
MMRTPQIELDFAEIRALFTRKDARFLRLVQSAWQRAGMFFIGKIVKEQMSGRVQPNFGLNVQHGQLRRSWYPLTEIQNHDVRTRIQTDSPYARPHQYGATIKHPARARVLTFRKTRKGNRFAKDKKVTHAGRIRKLTQKVVSVGSYEIKIPKRLYVIEEFKSSGLKLYISEVREALNIFKRRAK